MILKQTKTEIKNQTNQFHLTIMNWWLERIEKWNDEKSIIHIDNDDDAFFHQK